MCEYLPSVKTRLSTQASLKCQTHYTVCWNMPLTVNMQLAKEECEGLLYVTARLSTRTSLYSHIHHTMYAFNKTMQLSTKEAFYTFTENCSCFFE